MRRTSTIDGYRTAIVDTLGPAGLHISQSSHLNRFSFHRDHPKSTRNLPWKFSVVLNDLTKAPFKPMKDTDLKHLTLKTAFLLTLASGKLFSEIHAWVANRVLNLGQWGIVWVLYGSNQRPKRVSIPTFHFLQGRTHLRHQTRYTLFLGKTNYVTLLQTSRSTSLGFGPS